MLHRVLCCLLLTAPAVAVTDAAQRFGALCSRARAGGGVVRVLHFGDSHLGGMEANQEFSRFFHDSYGNGGSGFCLPWVARKPGLTARVSSGWVKNRKALRDGSSGLAGMSLETRTTGAWAEVEGRFSSLRLYAAKDPQGGKVLLKVDNVPVGEVELGGTAGELAQFQQQWPSRSAARKLTVQVTRPGVVRLLGVTLEEGAGAIYSPLSCNGAQLSWLNEVPLGLFRAQVQAEAPDLVMLAFGTNEANDRNLSLEVYRKGLEAVLTRFQKAAPQAALMLVGPPDGVLTHGSPELLAGVIATQRAVAGSFHAMFVDQREAMGGAGAIEAWRRLGWASSDKVHMTAPGYQRLAQACLEGMLAGTGQGAAVHALQGRKLRPAQSPVGPGRAEGRAVERSAESHPLYIFRNQDGRVFITDDPAQVKNQPGTWIKESPR